LLVLGGRKKRTDHSVLRVNAPESTPVHFAEPKQKAADIRVAP
jgi:hypothetical protein